MLDVPTTFSARIRIKKKLYAKAIYDNTADSPDELSFKKGDILTVFEQNTDDLEGWWLCSFRGQQGLCPGNRLRILNSYDSGCFSPSPPSSPCPSLAASTVTLSSSIFSGEVYENSSIISGTEGIGGCSISSTSQTQLNENSLHQNHQHQNAQYYQPRQRHRQTTRRSWHVSTKQCYGDVYVQNLSKANHIHSLSPEQRYGIHQRLPQSERIYQNVTPMMSNSANNEFETYDIPKSATPVNYDCPKNVFPIPPPMYSATMNSSAVGGVQEKSYDVPRPLSSTVLQRKLTLTSSSSNASLHPNESQSLSAWSLNRSSLTNIGDYDIPRRNPIPVRPLQKQLLNHQQQTVQTNCMTYDFPLLSNKPIPDHEKSHSSYSKPSHATPIYALSNSNKELPLELSSALETLAKLQSEATLAITRLLSFVSPNWRLREKLEPVLMEVKLAALRLRSALHDLTEFGEGSLCNASNSEDCTLAPKLRPLIRALRDADKLIHNSSQNLEDQGGWTLDNLVRDDKNAYKPPDSLDQLIACAQTLTEDVRQTASFIQGNALLLFKRTLPTVLPDNDAAIESATAKSQTYDHTDNTSSISTPNSDWLEDYDYVSFESKDAAAIKHSALREAIPQNQKNNFDTAIKAAETTVMATASSAVLPASVAKPNFEELTDKDKLVVRYYSKQISNHMGNLQQAIDSFLETVEKNQPPKFFIAYGKFVVVSAHNLVTIGDIVHRNVSKTELREKILCCTDALSDALKACVTKSKKAAAHFPSVMAVQEMVDSVMNIRNLACDLKNAMLHAVQLSL